MRRETLVDILKKQPSLAKTFTNRIASNSINSTASSSGIYLGTSPIEAEPLPDNFWECDSLRDRKEWLYSRMHPNKKRDEIYEDDMDKFFVDYIMQHEFPTELLVSQV